MTREESIKAAKHGAIAAFVSGTITTIIVAIAIFNNSEGALRIWNDPLNFIDIVLVFGCAIGMLRRSRTAAVVILVYFIISKILIWTETGKISGIALSLVFIYYFAKAVQGTFAYHKIEKAENPDYKPTPKWLLYTSIPVAGLVLLLVIVGYMTMTGVIPSTKVLAGTEVLTKDKETLVKNELLAKEETIEYFYSDALTSILDSGYILTDYRLVLYYRDEQNEMQAYQIMNKDMASAELLQQGSFSSPSVYKINSHEKDAWLQIALSVEDKGDIKFIDAIKKRINRNRK